MSDGGRSFGYHLNNKEMEKCLYDRWFDEELKNTSGFLTLLFQTYQRADRTNKKKIIDTWPHLFEGSQNL